jgi:predicted ribosome quality control (RQC) complex YloA/Tae2 family protein
VKIVRLENVPHLSLLDIGETIREHHDPAKAVTDFFYYYTHVYNFEIQKADILRKIRARLQNSRNYVEKTRLMLQRVEKNDNYKMWADLIMANLLSIKPNSTEVSLPDFYDAGKDVIVRLKPLLSPQKNAELYYKKAKNQQIEIGHLQSAISNKEALSVSFRQMLSEVEKVKDMKDLRPYADQFRGEEKEELAVSLPYHEFDFHGFRILVGKNATDNDELTFRHSYKEDLWLHAKDVAGSHVLIKHQSGKKFPKDVIERAAQLAAYNSKRKTETLCPVSYTPKKYVRKRKGDPAGMVVVEREDVVMVEPKL